MASIILNNNVILYLSTQENNKDRILFKIEDSQKRLFEEQYDFEVIQDLFEEEITHRLNQSGIGPLGFGGKTTVLGCYLNIGNQRASGVRIVSIRPSCFVEPRVFTLKL